MSTLSGPPVRRAASDVPGITGVRFLPQEADAALVNISSKGLLAESAARLVVDAPVQVEFIGRFAPAMVTGRVVRCQLAMMGPDGLLRYDIAVEFDTPIELHDAVATGDVLAAPDDVVAHDEVALADEVAADAVTLSVEVAALERPIASTARNRW